MDKKSSVMICSHCIGEFNPTDLYWVNKPMHRNSEKHGIYRTPYCEKCLKAKDTYISVHEPVKKKKTKKK